MDTETETETESIRRSIKYRRRRAFRGAGGSGDGDRDRFGAGGGEQSEEHLEQETESIIWTFLNHESVGLFQFIEKVWMCCDFTIVVVNEGKINNRFYLVVNKKKKY